MKSRDLFGTDPNFPGLPYTVSASVVNIRDNMLAVRKSLDVLNVNEAKCLMQAMDALESLFIELQERFAPTPGLRGTTAAQAALPPNKKDVDMAPDIMDKDTMISILASVGINYYPKIVAVEVAGGIRRVTSTGCPSLDVYDLALSLMDGEISSADAVTKLVHIGDLINEKDGTREEVEYFRDKLARIDALKTGKRDACRCSGKTGG